MDWHSQCKNYFFLPFTLGIVFRKSLVLFHKPVSNLKKRNISSGKGNFIRYPVGREMRAVCSELKSEGKGWVERVALFSCFVTGSILPIPLAECHLTVPNINSFIYSVKTNGKCHLNVLRTLPLGPNLK